MFDCSLRHPFWSEELQTSSCSVFGSIYPVYFPNHNVDAHCGDLSSGLLAQRCDVASVKRVLYLRSVVTSVMPPPVDRQQAFIRAQLTLHHTT